MSAKTSIVELPWWYRQEPQKFMSSPDVELMTAEEIGTYFLLLQKAWLLGEGCTLPNDPARLAKLARVSQVADIVLGKFSLDKNGRLYNPRLSMEWNAALKRSKDSRKANATRWNGDIRPDSDRIPTGLPSESDPHPKTEQNSTEQKKRKTMQTHTDASEAGASFSGSTSTSAAPGALPSGLAANLAQILGRSNLKPTTLVAWAHQAEGLLHEHDAGKVQAVMTWALTDSKDGFWRGRIFAMKNFVRCFNALLTQYERRSQKPAATADTLAARTASLKTGHDFSAIAKGDL